MLYDKIKCVRGPSRRGARRGRTGSLTPLRIGRARRGDSTRRRLMPSSSTLIGSSGRANRMTRKTAGARRTRARLFPSGLWSVPLVVTREVPKLTLHLLTLQESDPLVEWTDEFGRTRFIPRSEVPRGSAVDDAPAADEYLPLLPCSSEHPTDFTPSFPSRTNVHYGDQHHFPVYTPDPAVLAARAAAYAKSEPLVSHYDATGEKRSKAAG